MTGSTGLAARFSTLSPLASGGGNPHIASMPQERSDTPAEGRLPAAPLAVTRLVLTNFRSYASARLTVDCRPVVLTGPNGAGKTNLLEAVSLLAPGRGLRRAKLTEMDRRPSADADPVGAWALSATAETPAGPVQIGTGRDAGSESGERRLVRLDGAPAKSQAALAEHVNVVWLTPQMDRLFLEGSSARRRFLDRLVYGFDPGHAARLAGYEQAMRERAKLLRDGAGDASWLTALEIQMAERGTAIAAGRRHVVELLDRACAEGIGPCPQARMALTGLLEDALADQPALAVEDEFRAKLAGARRVDAESGVTTLGAHRSDFSVRHVKSGMPAAHCSTGEQKALLISILLAHARLQAGMRGATPLLLLDEVAAHLDAARRKALFAELLALGAQAWLTGTDEILFEGLEGQGQFFGVVDATISPR